MNEATGAFQLVGVGKPPATEAVRRSSGLDQLAKYITSQDLSVPRQAEKLIRDIANGTEDEVLIVFNSSRDRAAAVRVPEKINETYKLNHFDVPADLPNIRKAITMTVHMQSIDKYPGVALLEKYNEQDKAFNIRVTSINIRGLVVRNDPLLHIIRKTQAELNAAPSSS